MPPLRLKPFLLTLLLSISTSSFADPVNIAANLPEQTPLGADLSAIQPGSTQEADLWNRIRQGYGIPDLESPLVNSQLNWYSARTDYILRTTERASRYLYHVVEELEKRGMPTELAGPDLT